MSRIGHHFDYFYLNWFLGFGFVSSGGFGKKRKVGKQDKEDDDINDILTCEKKVKENRDGLEKCLKW